MTLTPCVSDDEIVARLHALYASDLAAFKARTFTAREFDLIAARPPQDRFLRRDEVLAVYPETEWFAGDPAPVGRRVVVREITSRGGRQLGTVLGAFVQARPSPQHGCSSCEHFSGPTPLGWWIVRLDGRSEASIEYPPGLRPLEKAQAISGPNEAHP